jgi:hypothetical protein
MSDMSLEVGIRLIDLRKALSKDSGEEWTPARLAKESGLSEKVINGLEDSTGSMPNLTKLLTFYHNKGFNVKWVITTDNSSIPMYREDKT